MGVLYSRKLITAGHRMSAVLWITILAVSLVTFEATADGFRNPPHSSVGTVRISGKAYSGDASAVTHNPANLAELNEKSAIISNAALYGPLEFESTGGAKEGTRDNWVILPNLFSAWPLGGEKEIVAGLGITTPFGQSTRWNRTSALQYSSPYFAGMKLINFNPSLGLKFNDSILFGLGLDIFYSELTTHQLINWDSAAMVPPGTLPDGRIRTEGDGIGHGYNLGLTWLIDERQRIGLTYRSQVSVNYDGDFRVSNNPGLPIASKSDFETDIDFPVILGIGYGLKINDDIRIEVDAEWAEHSTFDKFSFDLGANNGTPLAAPIRQDWKNNWTFGLSADWQVSELWMLRFGYLYVESPIPDKTLLAVLPDLDRNVLSLGAEYVKDKHTVNVGYSYLLGDSRKVDDNQNPAFNGKYEGTSHMFALSYNYSF